MVRRSAVALLDGAWEWMVVFLEVSDEVSHAHWSAYEYTDMPHGLPVDIQARALLLILRTPPRHAAFHERAVLPADMLLSHVMLGDASQSQLFEVLSEDD